MGTDQSIFPYPTLGNPEDQSMSDLPFPNPTLRNPEDHPWTSLSDADISLTSSHRHPTALGNPGDQSMSDLPLASSHRHYNPGDQSMDRSLLPAELLETDPFEFDASEYIYWSAVPVPDGFGDDDLHSVPGIRVDGAPSLGLAVDSGVRGEIGQPASASFGADNFFHVAVGDELPEPTGHGSHVQMHDGQFLAHVVDAVLEAGPLGNDDGGGGGTRPLPVGHVALSATEPDYLRLKSAQAQGFIESTDEVGNNPGLSSWDRLTTDSIRLCRDLTEKGYQHDADVIRDLRRLRVESDRKQCGITPTRQYIDGWKNLWKMDSLVHPQEPPTTSTRSYFTSFMTRLEGDKPKAGYWKEKDVKAIRDPSAPRSIMGLKRTLEYMKDNKRTHWLADEFVALEPCGSDAVQIQEEIVVRTVYEEGRETAPPSKCSKTDAHSSGESYIWQHMTRVYVKGEGEGGSTMAPSLLYAICHECDKALKCPPKFGNGNLNKHLERVHDICSPCKSQHVMTKAKGKGVVAASVVRV
ncbi:unnamed protein product [Urochloa decumbens]